MSVHIAGISATRRPERAMLVRMDTAEFIAFLANPHSLEDTKTADYEQEAPAGAMAPIPQFKAGGPREIRFTCRFIAQGNADEIDQQIAFLEGLVHPVREGYEPPLAMLTLGRFREPIRVTSLRRAVDSWTPGLRPRDTTVEVVAVVDYKIRMRPDQPRPGAKDYQAARVRAQTRTPQVKKIIVRPQAERPQLPGGVQAYG